MKDKAHLLFIVEGAKREVGIMKNLSRVFFNGKSEVVTVLVPAEMNVYMLYSLMKADDFETDIVELLREKVPSTRDVLQGFNRDDFAEVYYFFDFDEHANNLRGKENIDALKEMLGHLDNETELGKLYISYPMVEAIRDYVPDGCASSGPNCFIHRSDFRSYKNASAINPAHAAVKDFSFEQWRDIIANYVYRASCLFSFQDLAYDAFVSSVYPRFIFEKQMVFYQRAERVMILSCLPEFLVDYSRKYWIAAIGKRQKPIVRRSCPRKAF